ncbi:hypothetical protein [Bizionia paragorgiae]|uniref:Uncharacterized protein n=1 Tax=Bizionia paragorgiae TaxID=283786 RepID=A0A1H3VZR6_BIZPA|nr:hypothetical protein [Bizionia paragorgiae]SDZ80375.1 hypothetical protein SAMN04487990_102146 [Bizionia paragorgiae]
MKKLLLVLLLSYSITAFAQLDVGNIDLNFGATIENNDGDVIQIAGERHNTIYALSRKKKDFFLQTFDASTKGFKSSSLLEFEKKNGGKLQIEDLVIVGEKVFLMVSYFDKKADTYNFLAKEIEGNKIVKTTHVFSVPVENKRNKGSFVFTTSYDEFNYLVAHVGINTKEEQLKYTVTLLDDNLTEVLKDSYEVVFQDKNRQQYDFSDVQVNEHGDVLIATTESYRDKKNKTSVNTITIHSYLASNNYTKQVTNVSLTGKRALNCSLIETKDNTLHAIGFYSDIKKSGKAESTVEGIYNVTFNYNTGEVTKKTFNAFSFDVKKHLIGERRAKKGKDLKPFYQNIAFVERENGGVIVLSEYKVIIEGASSGFGPLSITPYTYITNEIIVSALKKDGTLDWSNVIPKEQQITVRELGFSVGFLGSSGGVSVSAGMYFPLAVLGSGPEYLSAIPIYHNGQLTVLVNDDPKNIGITKMDDVKKVRNVNKMIPVAFSFNEQTGELTRTDPTEFEKKQIVVRPSTKYKKASNSYLIYGGNKEGNTLGELTITK